MGWRNRFHLLMDGTASHIAKGKQRGMREFCGHFAMCYPGPHEQNSTRRKLVALILWCSFPDCVYSVLPSLTVNELTVPLFKTSSPTSPVTYGRMCGPANDSFSNPSSSTTPSSKQNHWAISQSHQCASLLTTLFASALAFPHHFRLFST